MYGNEPDLKDSQQVQAYPTHITFFMRRQEGYERQS